MRTSFLGCLLWCSLAWVNCAVLETTTNHPAYSTAAKHGLCPKDYLAEQQQIQTNCVNETLSGCFTDSDCEEDQKCCFNGCNNSCIYPIYTGCQQLHFLLKRQASLSDDTKNMFVPKCKDNGMFEDVQCDETSGKCWCVDDLGFELAGTRESSRDLVNCSASRPCADVLCRMLCPYGFELDSEGCPLCRCRNPCAGVECSSGQECQLEEIPCAEEICPPLPTCKQPRSLDGLCPMGTPLSSPDSGSPFLCGLDTNKPQCPATYLCDVMPGNDYGVCCPLVDKPGQCPAELSEKESCGQACEIDMDCEGTSKCCSSERCDKVCLKPANVTLCLQQKAVVELLLSSNPGYEGYIPQCLENGAFSPKQCSVNGHLCWCVTINGTIIVGTMGLADGVNCEEKQLERDHEEEEEDEVEARNPFQCEELNCEQECENGYKYNGRGCRICECAEPCLDIACPYGLECVLLKVDDCDSVHCLPVPTCKDVNALCSWGKPFYQNDTDRLSNCNECPETHECENLHGSNLCCPKKIAIESTKPQECPYHVKEPDTCDITCSSDSHCEGELKCCHSKSCGAICVPPQPPRLPTMCEYLRETGLELKDSAQNISLAFPIPQCLLDGAFNSKQCNEIGECWCVDEFGVEIIKTRRNNSNMDCILIREEMSCLGLICRLGCDFGFVMDDEGCPLCSCRNPCQNSSCGSNEVCQFMEVNCKEDWCPPLPHCVPRKASARNLLECSVGSPMLYEDDNEPVMCDPFFQYPQCPSTHDCVVTNPTEFGICCPRVFDISENEDASLQPVSQNTEGQCPYLIPTQLESCDYQCSSDDVCSEVEKCCSNGCGTRCTEPILKTSCQHQRAASEYRTRELGIPAYHSFLPNCTDDGDFAAVQCHPISKQCWCVDIAGLEIPGTRVKEQKFITCIPEVEQCPKLNCELFCPNGYQIDSNNCPTCSCYNPCEGFKCKNPDESCRMIQVSCTTDPCPPMPLCLPKLENPCPLGEPLNNDSGSLVHCGPAGDQCPSTHRCHLSPLREYAVCCPKPTSTSCELLKKKNHNFRAVSNKIIFLPKCNKKTGAWDPTQCMESLGLCWCVDSDGNQLPGTLIRGVPHCTARLGKSIVDTPICENGQPVHICPETLCEGKICLAHPNAICRINPCGGCLPQFIDEYNNPLNCNEGLTACFAEVQEMVNNRLAPSPVLHYDSHPIESRKSLEELSTPPPIYPPPPPPPHLSLDFNHHRILIDYDYDESQHIRDYDTYDPPLEDYGIHDVRVLHSMNYPVIMSPKVERVQIKMTARTAPFLQPLETEPLIEVVATQPKYQVFGISRKFTLVDHADSSLLMKPGICPAPSLISILQSIAHGCSNQCITDLDCSGSSKCCLHTCGMSCVEPLLTSSNQRSSSESGDCPDSDAMNPLMCLFSSISCTSDEDCSGERKCCITICGSQCVNPRKGKKEFSFKPIMMQTTVPKCSPEGGYAVTQKQGELSWCVDQFGNPFHHTLTRGKVECSINGTVIYQRQMDRVCRNPSETHQVCRNECFQATCASNTEAKCVTDPCNHCSVSFVSADGILVDCQEKCKQPLAIGNCRSSLPRYYFNQSKKKCERFTYGGCQGNANNFESLEHCKEECERKVPRCEQPKEIGLCRAQMFRWFYNKATHRCEKFVYGGCGGNENNFETIEECKRTCPDLVICPWTNVNGDTLVPCSRSAACNNITCHGKNDVQCDVDPCLCKAKFVDRNGDPVACIETPMPTSEEPSFLRTASLAQYTRCESLLKRHTSGDSSYIPQCDENGEFYPVQCAQVKESESQCWCVDEAGMQLPSSSTFRKGNKTCKFVKVKRVEVTLVFKHDDPLYSTTMIPSMKRLINQFLRDLKAETTEVSVNVLPDSTHVMFSLLSDNKVQVAFKLEEMVRIQGIYIVFPKADMPVDYRASHFYHILDYKAETEEDSSVTANHIGRVGLDQDKSWTRFLLYTVIGSFVFLLLIYVIPLIIHKRRQKKGEEKSNSSLVSMVFNNITYGIIGKKSEEKTVPSDVPNVVVQTVESQYESLQKEEDDKASEVSEAPPAYDDVDEKDQSEKSEKH